MNKEQLRVVVAACIMTVLEDNPELALVKAALAISEITGLEPEQALDVALKIAIDKISFDPAVNLLFQLSK